jgi:hypothetical protein
MVIHKCLIFQGLLCLLWGGLITLGYAGDASAQWEAGASLTLAIPQGEFDEVSDAGTGLQLKGLYRMPSLPSLALKADLTFITYQYGQYYERGFLVETRTQSIRLTGGPQLSVRRQRIELYLSPMYGLYHFYTQDDIMWTVLTRTRNSNTGFGWNISGGVLIDIAHMPKRSFDLALDIGGSWQNVQQGFETDLEIEGERVNVTRDVKELCLHAGVVFLFR